MPYSHTIKGNWGTTVKTSAGYNWRNTRPNSNCNSGPTFIRTDHPLKNMEDRGIFDSECSGHMTGNKDHLEAFSDSDYAGANLDKKSTTGGCQFLRNRLISWQCKKQTIMATSTIKAEYIAAASCCGFKIK
ncbi:hypothetical protein Tco_0274452, partial [Tanacetum coccineum]